MQGWLTLDTIPDRVNVCISLPDAEPWQAQFLGAILELSKAENWEEFGALTALEMSDEWRAVLFDFVEGCQLKVSELWTADGATQIVGTDPVLGLGVSGPVYATGFNRDKFAIADDGFRSVAFNGNRAFVMISNNIEEFCLAHCQYNEISIISASSSFAAVAGGGVLSGTTGANDKTNMRMNNGLFYLENRRGLSLSYGLVFLGASD